ncbi:MAG TPA: serine/threonine-protein kinase, partial [Rugosimonospora sp.]|nr:serine/threonine-protein kinase [Rugosimonospora sp.]
MSRVFAAFDETLQRKVAVKVLAPDLAESFSVDRFRREIMLVASLQHPNIVPVLSAGEVGHLPYFVMPFVEGESLRARLRRGPLSVRETVSIMRDVARALNLAHERGIVHRDIKPDNVMLTAGVATVTDFGVAKALAAARRGGSGEQRAATPRPATLTSAGTAIGTPAYMAPEQAAGDPTTDHRADLYALGILGYEMLAGTAPFHGASARELMAAQLAGTPPPLERRRGDVPPELRQLIMQCLQKAPADRPATATGVVRVLENPDLVSGSYVVPGPSRQVRRREMAGAGMMVLLLAAVAYGFWPTRAPAPDRAASGAPAAPAAAPAGTTLLIPTLQSPAGDATARQTAAGLTE